MDLATVVNYYCRKIGIWFLGLIPVLLAFMLIVLALTAFTSDISGIESPKDFGPPLEDPIHLTATIIYIILIIIALPFTLNGIFMEKAFNKEIERIHASGLLIRGVEGFDDVESSIKLLYRGSYSVTGSVIISFLVFLSATFVQTVSNDVPLFLLARIFIFFASVGLLAISSGASILLRLPDKSALRPGGLMKFYSPKSIALKLDNLITDSIFTHLDPVTRIRMDEWSKSIEDSFNADYLKDEQNQTRIERAREKIFLMIYLKEFIPELMTEEIFRSEVSEIIDAKYFDDFTSGRYSGISSEVLTTIIRDVKSEIPEIVELVQRIFVLVKDDLAYLNNQEEYITICHPTIHIGNIDPFRIVVFVLNLKEIQRKVIIQAQTSMSSLDPDDASQILLLDPSNINLPSEDGALEFSSSKSPVDMLTLVSAILQVGDAINLQFRANRFGTHVLNISVADPENGIISGRSVVVEVQRDLAYYLKTVGAKALGYVGAAVSFIGIGLGSLVGILGR
jgi:hypothetical protein